MFNDQSFNDTLTNDIVSFEQLGPGQWLVLKCLIYSFVVINAASFVLWDQFLWFYKNVHTICFILSCTVVSCVCYLSEMFFLMKVSYWYLNLF